MQSRRLRTRLIRLKRVKSYFRCLVFLIALALAGATVKFEPSPEMYRALAAVSADSLRGNLSFIASDLLEGRDTPSRGLDLAAEYIAAQFRSASLDAVGDEGYFQTAHLLHTIPPAGDFELKLQNGANALAVSKDEVAIVSRTSLDLNAAQVFKIRKFEDLPSGDLAGKGVMLAGKHSRELAKAAAHRHPAVF